MSDITKITEDAAVYQVFKWMLDGNDEKQIAESLAELHPKSNATAILTTLTDHFHEVGNVDPMTIRGWAIEATREMYQRLVSMGDYPNALRAIRDLDRLANATTRTTFEHNDVSVDQHK